VREVVEVGLDADLRDVEHARLGVGHPPVGELEDLDLVRTGRDVGGKARRVRNSALPRKLTVPTSSG
jgi:hypothetical protein